MLYESLVVFAVLLIGFLLPQILLSAFGLGMSNKILWLHVLALLMLYFVWFWHRAGQTLAMQTWRLKLIDASTGATLTLPRAIARYALSWPSLLFFGAGVLWSVFDRERQFLHDRLAGTRIVQLPRG